MSLGFNTMLLWKKQNLPELHWEDENWARLAKNQTPLKASASFSLYIALTVKKRQNKKGNKWQNFLVCEPL